MDIWFLIALSLCTLALIKSSLDFLISSSLSPKLPPGPPKLALIGNFLWLRKSFMDLEPILRSLHAKHGPMVSLQVGSHAAIFVSDHSLTHQALVQRAATFADRPPPYYITKVMSSNQHTINSASYGPTWRLLRRNLTSGIFHPSHINSYSISRRWVVDTLLDKLRAEHPGSVVSVMEHFQHAMFRLLALMCFGNRLEDRQIRDLESVQMGILHNIRKFAVLSFLPSVGKFLFRRRWKEFHELLKDQENVLLPLIRARSEIRGNVSKNNNIDAEHVLSYVDTLLSLELSHQGNRKLTEAEIISLSSEFLDAGTDTTSTSLEWIMANIVKHSKLQETLYAEMRAVVDPKVTTVTEEDLQRMPYLKAVVLEGLRRHPPAHFVLPHTVTEDTELGGYLVPKTGSINFMVAEMGWDPAVWEDPLAFKPERFLSKGLQGQREVVAIDITGRKEIKMMPFGAGRRMCPGYALALLHLEYFVANLVLAFEWKVAEGEEIDFSEKQEFVMSMKNPLRAIVSPRA